MPAHNIGPHRALSIAIPRTRVAARLHPRNRNVYIPQLLQRDRRVARGRNSVVESQPSKLLVVGSNPIARFLTIHAR